MNPLTQVEVARLVLDERCQQRSIFEAEWVADAVAFLESGGKFSEPIVVVYDGAHYYVADGFVRTRAFLQHGVKYTEADVKRGSLRDAVEWSCGANVAHGNRRKPADIRKAVVRLLSEDDWGRPSDQRIAAICKVPLATVQRIKAEMIEEAEAKEEAAEAKTPVLYALTVPQTEQLTMLADALSRWLPIVEENEIPGRVGKKLQAVLDEVGTVMGAE